MQSSGHGQPNAPPKKNKTLIIVAIIAGVLVFGFVMLSVLSSVALTGLGRYMSAAKTAEGKSGVGSLARSIVACSEKEGLDPLSGSANSHGLPPTSAKVPAVLQQISGQKYTSTAADWSDPAFSCGAFSISVPQYFQYQWVLGAGKTSGVARAVADFDGDGTVDVTLEQAVSCTGSASDLSCSVGAQREIR